MLGNKNILKRRERSVDADSVHLSLGNREIESWKLMFYMQGSQTLVAVQRPQFYWCDAQVLNNIINAR